jgi:murein DD-endopeptidase MepM/ murein hydrolase activator NlpD
MYRLGKLLKKAFLPVTIMLVPHTNLKHFSFRIPLLGIIVSLVFFLSISVYLVSVAIEKNKFQKMEKRLSYYQNQFGDLNNSIREIKKAENEFRQLFRLKSKEKVLESIPAHQSGSVNMDDLRDQIQPTVETVNKIKEYLYQERNIYMATPKGLPVNGPISSTFGMRKGPFSGKMEFHPALDLRADIGSPVKTTADGVVSFAGWTKSGGNIVAIEHGFGYSTYYAHNKKLAVEAGQRVRRGMVIAYIGETGNATGPHSHYEIRENGKSVDPRRFLEKGQ